MTTSKSIFGVDRGLFHAKIFGERSGELTAIASAVDYALDLHRKHLITIVERFDEILTKIDHIDHENHYIFHSVHEKIRQYAIDVPSYWEQNEIVLQELLQPFALPLTYLILPAHSYDLHRSESERETSMDVGKDEQEMEEDQKSFKHAEISLDERREVLSYDSLIQVIIHLNRDWSEIGNSVRKKLYQDTILPLLQKYMPLQTKKDRRRVLVPGAGLGRLAAEVSALGYDVEANESSGSMLCMMYALFNQLLPNNSQRVIYPFLHLALQDDWDLEGRRTTISFPFVDDSLALKQHVYNHQQHVGNESIVANENKTCKVDNTDVGGEKVITLQYGDFARIYSGHPERKGTFDVVITNFFIDTGCDILEYLAAIKHVLVTGGIWINSGPLHYHTRQTIPYSFKHFVQIVELSGFDVLHNDRLQASYCGEDRFSMKPEVYNIAVSVFRLRPSQPQQTNQHNTDSTLPFHGPNYAIK